MDIMTERVTGGGAYMSRPGSGSHSGLSGNSPTYGADGIWSRYTASAVSMAIICNHNGNTLLALGDSNFLALLAFAAIL
ncbi:hypothetical protein PG999_005006 [Apiospora kogelbergensis]|uniref:Uncharacterized protein n=1 Tax=Apiospora kogelbergensis TaxID=1337665 RepID=A0AAW0R102_9PEZI